MTTLPSRALLVRTWFGDDRAWQQLVIAVRTPSDEGFEADVWLVDDIAFEGLTPDGLRSRHPGGGVVSFLADETALTRRDHPVVAVWTLPRGPEDRRPTPESFRVMVSALWSVENNINNANMDWEDFRSSVDAGGVFRGLAAPGAPQPSSDLELRGLAAVHRIVQDMTHTAAARALSGRRESVTSSRTIPCKRALAYDMATRVSFWITHGAIALPVTVGGGFQITSSWDYGSRQGMFGHLASIEGEYRVLDDPHRVELTWNWHPPRPASALLDPTPRFLDWSTVVRFDLEPVAHSEGGSHTQVTVTHAEVPVEWSSDVNDFWTWNLEHMQVLIAHSHA